jgi:RNase P protein component
VDIVVRPRTAAYRATFDELAVDLDSWLRSLSD